MNVTHENAAVNDDDNVYNSSDDGTNIDDL